MSSGHHVFTEVWPLVSSSPGRRTTSRSAALFSSPSRKHTIICRRVSIARRVIAARGSCRSKRTTRRRGLTRYSLANTPLVGTTLACTLLFGTTLTSTRLVGTTLAGTTLAGITLATTAHTGTALAGGTVSGTTPVDPTPTGTTSPGDTPPGCPVAGCSACSQPPRIRGWGRAKTGGAAEGVKDSWGPSASASPYQRARRLPIGWGEQNTKNSSCA